MISYFRGISLALTALALAGCGTAGDAAFIPLREMLYAPPPDRMLLVVETTSNLPRRSENDTASVFFTQVDLAANHAVMVGFNEAYIAGYDLRHGDLIGRQLVGPRAPYQMFSGPGPDYALTFYSRNDGVWLENVCYFENAIVYRLRPGVINYIPKELQPPLYNGRRQGGALRQPDTAELRRVLSRFPVSNMEIVVPEVVAIVRFDPDRLDQMISANDCSYNNSFTILERYDVDG